jgi:hypothetical protein
MPVSVDQLPFDILYPIILACSTLLPSHTNPIDSTTLRLLCNVSKSFNDIATPLLYSSITLPTERSVLSLASTARTNPKLLKSCHTLCLSLQLAGFHGSDQGIPNAKRAIEYIVTYTSSLRRFISFEFPCISMLPLLSGTTFEAAYIDEWFDNYDNVNIYQQVHKFANLERLTVTYIPFADHQAVDALMAMPRLTHLAVCDILAPNMNFNKKADYEGGIVRLLTHANLKRLVGGWTLFNQTTRSNELEGLDRLYKLLLASLPANHAPKVVFLLFDILMRSVRWFQVLVVNGTVWELEGQCCTSHLAAAIAHTLC